MIDPPAIASLPNAAIDLPVFRDAVAERFGLLFEAEDEPWLRHRLALALGGAPLEDEALARQVRGNAGAADRLAAAVAPAASAFCGTDPVIRALPAIAASVPRPLGVPLMVWSLGCGTGAEGYSALFALLDGGAPLAEVRVYGVDLVECALEHARAGVYGARELAGGVPVAWTDGHLVPAHGSWRVRDGAREAARWVRANLREPLPAMPRPHLVLCRDVLGWLGEETRRQALASVAERLVDQGVLIVGSSEAELVNGPFEPMGEPGAAVFRRATRGG